jgi:hypothetical protein
MNDNIIVKNPLLKEVETLRELISAYCVLRKNRLETEEAEKKLIEEIEKILISLKNINYTEFVAYWKCLDMQYGTFLEFVKEEKELAKSVLKELLEKYCKRREKIYLQFGYTHTTLQALYDSGSSRSKGQKFKDKIRDITLSTLPIKEITSSKEIEEGILIFITKKIWPVIKEKLSLKYHFGQSHQNKIPDFYISYKGHHIIGEAKHIHNTGGAQDKQITELISFIKQSENRNNIHYLAFLDGLYMRRFSRPYISDKIQRQKEDIEKALKLNPFNFFVNGNGLRVLLEDLRDE